MYIHCSSVTVLCSEKKTGYSHEVREPILYNSRPHLEYCWYLRTRAFRGIACLAGTDSLPRQYEERVVT